MQTRHQQTVRKIQALDGPVYVALSGGRDSTALAVIAADARTDVLALHVHHHWRPSAHRDAKSARQTAQRLGMAFQALHLSHALGGSPEATARQARYDAMAEQVRATGGTLMTAHHAMDRLESLLIGLDTAGHIASSLGPSPEMTWNDARVVRPLLEWTPDDLTQVCEMAGASYVADPTNRDVRFARNRLRRLALPGLMAALGSTWPHTLERWRTDIEAHEHVVSVLSAHLSTHAPGKVTLHRSILRSLPLPWRAQVVRDVLARLGSTRDAGPFIRMICVASESTEYREVTGPGELHATMSGDGIEIIAGPVEIALLDKQRSLPVDGEHVRLGHWRVRARLTQRFLPPGHDEPRWVFDADALDGPLEVRALRETDSFVPFGRQSEVRCTDRLANDGWDALRRARAVVVADPAGVLGILGGRRAHRALATDATGRYLEVTFWPESLDAWSLAR